MVVSKAGKSATMQMERASGSTRKKSSRAEENSTLDKNANTSATKKTTGGRVSSAKKTATKKKPTASKTSKDVEVVTFERQSSKGEQDNAKRSKVDYASEVYWNDRYATGDDAQKQFEWFLSFSDIEPILRRALPFNDRTGIFLDIGCGTSMFLRDLQRSGYKGSCIGLDYSAPAIDVMKARGDCQGINFKVCDAREIDDIVKGATAVLDKSLMDTMLHAKDKSLVPEMLQSVARALRADGTFISITQLDPRKEEDLEFLTEVVLKNLRSTYQSVSSVTVHLSEVPEGENATPVPTVIVYSFSAGSGKDDVEMNIIEYESSESADSDQIQSDEE